MLITANIYRRDALNWTANAVDGDGYGVSGTGTTPIAAQRYARQTAARQAKAWRLQGTHVGKHIAKRYVRLGRQFTK